MVKNEFEKGTTFDTALEARIDAMRELKENKRNLYRIAKKRAMS